MDNDKFQELVLEHFNKVFEKLDGMDNRIDKLETGQLRIETRIENEVIEKIRALFDDRSVNQDYFTSIKDSLARIEESIEFAHRRVSSHEFKLMEHDREFRLLRTERK